MKTWQPHTVHNLLLHPAYVGPHSYECSVRLYRCCVLSTYVVHFLSLPTAPPHHHDNFSITMATLHSPVRTNGARESMMCLSGTVPVHIQGVCMCVRACVCVCVCVCVHALYHSQLVNVRHHCCVEPPGPCLTPQHNFCVGLQIVGHQ